MAFPSPPITPPPLTSWQFSYNGVLLGATTPLGLLEIDGLGDLPTIRSADQGRARDHGELIGLDLYGGRDITFNVWAKTDGTSLQDTLNAFASATVVGLTTEQPLWFKLPNYPMLCCMCRPRKRTTPWDDTYAAAQIAKPVAEFHATDPRLYEPPQTATVGLPNPTAGMTFPATFPLTFGAPTSGNSVTCVNAGNVEMRPVLVITGPVTNPLMVNASIAGNPALELANPTQTGFTVLTGDQVVIDMDFHTVQYYVGGIKSGSPGASRESWVVPGSVWWNLPPGNNVIQFLSQDSSQVGGTLQIQWASAHVL